MLKKYLWKKAIKKACSATEGLENTFANYLTKSPGVKRYFRLLTKANTSNNLYRNFVITIDFRKFSSGYLDGKCFGEQKRLQPARHASTI